MPGTEGRQSRLNLTCAWCGDPGVTEIEVEPARAHQINGTLKKVRTIRPAHKVGACDIHARIATQPGPPPIEQLRRRKATGVEQLSLLDAQPTDGRRGGIHGEEAA